MSRPGFDYPNSEDCPKTIAEAVYDVHYGLSNDNTHSYLRNFWGTADYLIMAVEYVYHANGWPLGRKEKKVFRDIFRGKYPEA
jgi:hypothetical protein